MPVIDAIKLLSIISSKNLLIAGTASSAGKHTIACGIIRFLKKIGFSPVPFKPLVIERFSSQAAKYITPSIQIQAISAEIEPKFLMNPIRTIYSPQNLSCPSLYLNGVFQKDAVETLNDRSLIIKNVLESLKKVSFFGDIIVIEGTGGLSDWIGSNLADILIEYLDPIILLVVNAVHGGAIDSVLGTLKLVPQNWLSRI